LTGIIYSLIYLKIGFLNLELFFYFLIWALLISIFVYDLKHKIIPNLLVYTLITLSLIKALWFVQFGLNIDFLWLILAGPITASPFAFLWLISHGYWMGFGDAKLALAMGWLLGLLNGLSAIVFAFWIGAVVGIFLILLSKLNKLSLSVVFKNFTIKSEIPFAPFLIIGMGVVYFLEINILELLYF